MIPLEHFISALQDIAALRVSEPGPDVERGYWLVGAMQGIAQAALLMAGLRWDGASPAARGEQDVPAREPGHEACLAGIRVAAHWIGTVGIPHAGNGRIRCRYPNVAEALIRELLPSCEADPGLCRQWAQECAPRPAEPVDFICYHCGERFDLIDGDEPAESAARLGLGRTLCDACWRANVLAESHCCWCFDPYQRGEHGLACRRCEPEAFPGPRERVTGTEVRP